MTDTLIERSPEILDGTPCSPKPIRVPVRILVERLGAKDRLAYFFFRSIS